MHVLLESSACCSPVLVISSCWSCQCRFLFYELNIYAWCTFSRSYVTNCIHNIVPVKRMLACCRALLVAIFVELQLRCRFFIESGTIEMCWQEHRHAGHVHVIAFTKLQVVTNSVITFVSDSADTPARFRWYFFHTTSKWGDLGCVGIMTMRRFFGFWSQL